MIDKQGKKKKKVLKHFVQTIEAKISQNKKIKKISQNFFTAALMLNRGSSLRKVEVLKNILFK